MVGQSNPAGDVCTDYEAKRNEEDHRNCWCPHNLEAQCGCLYVWAFLSTPALIAFGKGILDRSFTGLLLPIVSDHENVHVASEKREELQAMDGRD